MSKEKEHLEKVAEYNRSIDNEIKSHRIMKKVDWALISGSSLLLVDDLARIINGDDCLKNTVWATIGLAGTIVFTSELINNIIAVNKAKSKYIDTDRIEILEELKTYTDEEQPKQLVKTKNNNKGNN